MNRITIFFLFLISIGFTACEEVVNVDLPTAESRLVVDATIDWQKGTQGEVQTIKLSTTAGYYDSSIPKVSGATVYITNSSNTVFNFTESEEAGNYVCQNFVPVINENYTLTIVYKNQTYTATEKLLASPAIKRVEQRNDGGFSGSDIEIKFFFDDIVDETNYYLVSAQNPHQAFPEYGVLEDRFFENNEISAFYIDEDLEHGDVLPFRLSGVSKNYFNFMNILLQQSGTNSGGPFSTPAATVRGNIINQTNFDNYALGYFRLSESDFMEYTVE